ncbi:hypothetical protein KUTeg_003627 [Tegillarca granosa]|uniref:inorganic diphosphatase n=1 Tax=Tegillarca granosa TaxID=220873 RepID=A0ABQ9FQW1_TEGGR|nr:hypothetical protein KUTeg_003627 [Tegillarca granosa]
MQRWIGKNGNIVSPFHDIPLYADTEKKVLNMVVEIPRWTNHKMETWEDPNHTDDETGTKGDNDPLDVCEIGYKATNEWFKIYKMPDGKPANTFAFNGEAKPRDYAMKVVEECHKHWEHLIAKDAESSGICWFV